MSEPVGLSRRELLRASAAGAGTLAFGAAFWRNALAAPVKAGTSAYGPLRDPDDNGLMLPRGFTSRVIARAGVPVPGTAYPWHVFSDGQATFATADGGWVLVSNSESLAASGAGSSAIRFDSSGRIVSAYRILAGTNANCAGGPTPWGAWLSCEEYDAGQVWECDPRGPGQGIVRPALGVFSHEAAAVDPVGRRVYMTEDDPGGCFYRFTPASYPSLTDGLLEVALVDAAGRVSWAPVPDPSAITGPTREQVAGAARFDGGEGIWYDSGTVYFSTKGDNRVRAYDTLGGTLEVIYNGDAAGAPLTGLDNLTVSATGDLYACEDGGDMEIGIITRDRVAARFLQLTGPAAEESEMAGVIFDPSGTRMYFSSQRGNDGRDLRQLGPSGTVYEVTGPFTGARKQTPPRPRSVALAPQPPAAESPVAASQPLGVSPDVKETLSLAALASGSLELGLDADGPGERLVALRTTGLERVPGARGSIERPRLTTLARATGPVPGGSGRTARLRLEPAAARLLAGHPGPVDAELVIGVPGRPALASRPVRLA